MKSAPKSNQESDQQLLNVLDEGYKQFESPREKKLFKQVALDHLNKLNGIPVVKANTIEDAIKQPVFAEPRKGFGTFLDRLGLFGVFSDTKTVKDARTKISNLRNNRI